MTKTVTLAQGILRGENRITDITVRKPLTKQLRGVSISRLIEMNADDWQIVLPRVTTPKVDKVDFSQMTVTDFTKLCSTAAELMFEDAEEIDADEDSTGKHDSFPNRWTMPLPTFPPCFTGRPLLLMK